MTTGKCAACPRTKPGLCFAEEFGLRHFCEWRAAGNHSHDPVLRGDVEPTRVAPPEMPGVLERAANFVGALAGHVAAGCPTADAATVATRLAVCEPCPQRLPGGVCAGCGCDLKWKASWLDQKCPEGKWPTI